MQPNAIESTKRMLQPSAPSPEEQSDLLPESQEEIQSEDKSIIQHLEEHLNQVDDRQKQFLAQSLQHYANIVIPVLGIINGPEVFDYFLNIYQQNFAKGLPEQQAQQQQANSAPMPQQQQGLNQGQPMQAPQQQPAQPPVQQPL